MKRIYFYFLTGLFVLGLASGCAEKKVVKRESVIPAERVMIKMEAKRRRVKTFLGKGEIHIRAKSNENKFNFILKFKKPDSLYVAGYGPFGITIAEFILTDDSFEYYDDVNNKVYRGENPGRIIDKIFNINLAPNEFRNLLIGLADFNLDLRRAPKKYFYDKNHFHLVFRDSANAIRKYEIERKEMALEEFDLTGGKSSAVKLNVKYSDFKDYARGKLFLPSRIKVVSKNPFTSLNITYKHIEINKKISSLRFIIPNDAQVIEW